MQPASRHTSTATRLATLILSITLLLPGISFAQAIDEDPAAFAMAADLAIARPLLLVTTVAGAAVYLVSLPFTLAGGNAKQAGNSLVVKPAKATFVRCLGCVTSGYKKDVK